MNQLIYDPEFTKNLVEFQRYVIEHFHSRQSALKIKNTILKPIRLLKTSPELGIPVTNLYNNIKPEYQNYRRLIAGNYIVLYEFDVKTSIVYVDYVFAGQTDWASELAEE